MNKAEQLSIMCAIIYAHNPESGIEAALNDAKEIAQRTKHDVLREIRLEEIRVAKSVNERHSIDDY